MSISFVAGSDYLVFLDSHPASRQQEIENLNGSLPYPSLRDLPYLTKKKKKKESKI
jgi:hypothetical protein